jgi:CRISPR-associated protein Csd1
MVPESVVRSGKPTPKSAKPNFLWDNAGYVLGVDNKGKKGNASITFNAFKNFHHKIGDASGDAGMQAVLRFLDRWTNDKISTISNWQDILDSNGNLVFLLEGDTQFVHERKAVRDLWLTYKKDTVEDVLSTCLITGKQMPIARLHPKIKGVRYAQSSGASIVSFNLDAFCSYNKEQNYNAPISEDAAFAYTTALNYLLRYDSRQKIQIGETTTVFWTERKSAVENVWGEMFNPSNTDSADTKEVHDYLSAVREGKNPPGIDTSVTMYILGLSPNASRLAIRFWITDTINAFNRNLRSHFNNLRIEKQYKNDKDFPGIWQLIIETLPKKMELRKSENINPLLSGIYMKSVLTGGRYPESLLAALIRRLRADGDVSYYRAAQIKAILKRNYQKEVSMGLDENNTNIAYRLGRLFAVLEKAQEEAIPGANATIKDRFYGSASATPGVVFPQLLRMGQHHLAKIGEGSRIAKEKMIQSIVEGIDSFPRHLPLEEQGQFSLGYYHQRNAFFRKKVTDEVVITK